MIVRVEGELAEVGASFAVVMVGGVGYQLFVSELVLASLSPVGTRVELHARQIVRDNDISLYGFATSGERRLFDLLITANGLGPKSAISMLGAVGEEGTVAAILSNDPKTLTRAPGVGMKLAQRVCLDLADKVREESLLGRFSTGTAVASDDVVEALISLGHRRSDAERAAVSAREEAGDAGPQTLIPIALKHASRK